MALKEYLNSTFPGLQLKSNLYDEWDIRLHIRLAEGIYQFKDNGQLNLEMFEMVYYQALTIFNHLFSEQDEIFLVTNVCHRKRNYRKVKVKVYDRYLKNKSLKYKVRQEVKPCLFDDEEHEQYISSQYYLKCRKSDINYSLLIKAICNEDFQPLKPRFGRDKGSYYPDVFFVNASKNIILFIYDDRGCEVIAQNKETIRPLYEQYHDWVDDYYREENELLFK
ncbi:hypothetical protein BFG57_15840 [Bacillus solimangrovi]|uniref:DUF3885 domain-containing protein n=1 Tax=Bacillus solimangrovi TaxID=1305675 RepID=A0A1E5LEH7_9BACI|nr:hypothetical protein BFG57_15840 [Bacillus solimangrovi]